jgi:predicted enzyme related to lactoylglutathione lyase
MTTYGDLPAPRQGLILTHFLTLRDVAVSRDFYADVLGREVALEENPAIVKVANSWIIMNPGGGPTPDKPEVTLAPPEPGDPVSAFINVRVADIASFHREATAKGAQFLTEPLDRKADCAATCAIPTATWSRSGRPPACWRACSPTHRPATSADASRD